MGVSDILSRQFQWREQIRNETDPNKRILEIEIDNVGPKLVFFEGYEPKTDMYTFQTREHTRIRLHNYRFAIYWIFSGECHEKALMGKGVNMKGCGNNEIVGFI